MNFYGLFVIATAFTLCSTHTVETYNNLTILNKPQAITSRPDLPKIYVVNDDSSLAVLDIDQGKISKGFKITNDLLGDTFLKKPIDLALDDVKKIIRFKQRKSVDHF